VSNKEYYENERPPNWYANAQNEANAANAANSIAIAMMVVGGLSTVGSVLAFILMGGGSEEAAEAAAPRLELDYVGPAFLPDASPGVGVGFSF